MTTLRTFMAILIILTLLNLAADSFTRKVESDAYPKGYYNGDPVPDNTVYFTFDDGPTDLTGDILDILKMENIKATFFICAYWNNKKMAGRNAFQKHRRVLLRLIREGHVLANHTVGHKVLSNLPSEEIEWQFKQNQRLLNRALGREAPLMTILRLPLGRPWSNKTSIKTKSYVGRIIRKIGLIAMWSKEFDSTDSWDWAKGEWYRKTARVDENNPYFIEKRDRIFQKIISNADGRGMVILMHDTHPTAKSALPLIIRELKRKGYIFKTMEEYYIWRFSKGSKELLSH